MLIKNIKRRMNSDTAAVGSVETVLLIAIAIFAVIAITNYIMKPLEETSKGIGSQIEKMNPE